MAWREQGPGWWGCRDEASEGHGSGGRCPEANDPILIACVSLHTASRLQS